MRCDAQVSGVVGWFGRLTGYSLLGFCLALLLTCKVAGLLFRLARLRFGGQPEAFASLCCMRRRSGTCLQMAMRICHLQVVK
jgi:Flp pilus assembly protein TadB